MAMAEARTLATLAELKRNLIDLKHLPERTAYEQISQQYADRLQQWAVGHRQRKQERDCKRSHYRKILQGDALETMLNALNRESQQDSTEYRYLKQARTQALNPLAEAIAQADQQAQTLKRCYTDLSGRWQAQMQAAYFAAQAGAVQPLDVENLTLPILYQDEALIVVDKPAGLLSVPGRRYHLQDSVLSRLRYQLPNCSFLQLIHRLDQDTSGLLAVAIAADAHVALSQQFAQRQVHKTYEAILSRPIDTLSGSFCGTVELPLWSNPETRPRQMVDFQRGKPSRTDVRILTPGEQPRAELTPRTGRTHQLRVHTAHREGLNAPILGDALYGSSRPTERLHLHATALELVHPVTSEGLRFSSIAPF
jgi:RluA family pseudouridine synthase